MKKFLIEESEKTKILSMHKVLMKEQNSSEEIEEQDVKGGINSEEDILRKSIKAGCLKNGKILTNADRSKFVYRATTKSGKEVDFLGDMSYKFKDGSKSGKWVCKALDVVQPQPQVDPNAGDIENLLKSGVWFKKEDLAKQGISEDELVSNWTQHPKYKNLYKRQGAGPSKSSGFDTNQQSFVDAWMKNPEVADNINRGIYNINPSAADFATGQWRVDNYFIADNSENYFPADSKGVKGLKVYFNNAKVTEKLSRENCRVKIKEFADKFKLSNSKPQSSQWITTNRAFVQQCADNFKFGGALSKIDDDLNLVGGMIEGGAGNSSPWHINLNKKLR
jgi:hypothetical protein